jgi:hypothetical protein
LTDSALWCVTQLNKFSWCSNPDVCIRTGQVAHQHNLCHQLGFIFDMVIWYAQSKEFCFKKTSVLGYGWLHILWCCCNCGTWEVEIVAYFNESSFMSRVTHLQQTAFEIKPSTSKTLTSFSDTSWQNFNASGTFRSTRFIFCQITSCSATVFHGFPQSFTSSAQCGAPVYLHTLVISDPVYPFSLSTIMLLSRASSTRTPSRHSFSSAARVSSVNQSQRCF